MRSAVRKDARNRLALKRPSLGLLYLYDTVTTPDEDSKHRSFSEWEYEPERTNAPETVKLREVFGYRLFHRTLLRGDPSDPVTDHTGTEKETVGPPLNPAESNGLNITEDRIGGRLRFGAEIPLGYLYSANGRIDSDWVAELEEQYEQKDYDIGHFRQHDAEEQQYPICREDVETLGEAFAEVLAHVERSLEHKSARVFD